jgi:hypothetical protein
LLDEVIGRDDLRTHLESKLEVRFLSGHWFVLSEQAAVTVEERDAGDGVKVAVLSLDSEQGAVRAVTGAQPGAVIVQAATGQAQARSTGFIVGCGPPVLREPNTCLFAGVYGVTDVESLAFPGRAVSVERQFFTKVRRGRRPDPPRRMPDEEFQALLDATTLVGTGSGEDRVGMSNPLAAGRQVFDAPVLGTTAGPPPWGEQPIPDDAPPIVCAYDPQCLGPALGSQPLPVPPPLSTP